MTEQEQLARAMAIVEAAVQDMADEGLTAMQRSVALAWHMNAQVDQAMPMKATANAWKAQLIK